MNVEIGAEAALFPEKEYINGIAVAVQGSPYRLGAISQGPKNSRIPGPDPLPFPLVMDMHATKTLCTGLYKS